MRIERKYVSALALMAASALPASAQQNDQSFDPPARIISSQRNIEVQPDGTWKVSLHNEVKLLSQLAVTKLGQPALAYSDQTQELEIKDAYTLKPDGTKIAVSPDAILTQQSPVSANAPMLTDQKQKVILYPNVDVGDTLVYDTTTTIKPRFAGNFTYDTIMPTVLVLDDANVTVKVPKSMSPVIDASGLDVSKKTDGDQVIYAAHFSNAKPLIHSPLQSEFDQEPRLTVSTFKNYDALAAAYAQLIQPALQVTPAIQAKADEITTGVKDRKLQAQKLYDWIGAHVRYVALEFGQGGIVPHDAARTLDVGYGDCKDQAALFAALLKAKGIDSNLVLINATNAYTAPKVASLGTFNHVILWLPEFHLYADTTDGRLAPFGVIPHVENGKPSLVIGLRSGALRDMPLTDASASTVAYKLAIVTDAAGHITSNSSISASGEFGIALRGLGSLMQGQDGTKLANTVLQKSATPRATGMLTAPPLDMDATSYGISGNYSTPGAIIGLTKDNVMPLADNLKVLSPFSAVFFGPLIEGRNRDIDAVPCYNGRAMDDESVQLSGNRHLAKLPDDQKMSREHASYSEHWSSDGNVVSVHRELTTRFDQTLCTSTAKGDLLAIGDRIRADQRTLLQLQVDKPDVPAAPAAATPAPAAAPATPQ